jgi:GT2 family glycosyltransferase
MAFGLTSAFRNTALFNPEGMGDWRRDSERHVDIVSGCFLMISRPLWQTLGGFDLKYWMYGEEADLCARARAIGYHPMITPDAQIMHLVGASTGQIARKTVMVARARTTLIRDHWPMVLVPFGIALMWVGGANRLLAARLLRLTGRSKARVQSEKWAHIWSDRHLWLAGYTS